MAIKKNVRGLFLFSHEISIVWMMWAKKLITLYKYRIICAYTGRVMCAMYSRMRARAHACVCIPLCVAVVFIGLRCRGAQEVI